MTQQQRKGNRASRSSTPHRKQSSDRVSAKGRSATPAPQRYDLEPEEDDFEAFEADVLRAIISTKDTSRTATRGSQNANNFIGEVPSVKLHQAPGGSSTVCLGTDETEQSKERKYHSAAGTSSIKTHDSFSERPTELSPQSQAGYLEDLRIQMKLNAERKRQQEAEELDLDRKVQSERTATYRRGGGGSPLRNSSGEIICRRRPMSNVTGGQWQSEHNEQPTSSNAHTPKQSANHSCEKSYSAAECERGFECRGCERLQIHTKHMASEVAGLQAQMAQMLAMMQLEKKRNNELSRLLLASSCS